MKSHNQLIRELHILLNRCGIGAVGKESILEAYGVTSSKMLTEVELREIIDKLHLELQKAGKEEPTKRDPIAIARKRVKAAVGNYLASLGKIPKSGWGLAEWNLITGVACRAAGVSSFNAISQSKLNSLYNAFLHGKQTADEVEKITQELMN